eukprot:m.69412 g.69412  ORF g.69412 m.69412 type:complete len:103 (+) comp14124_c0_seq4:100-408(+)
MDTADDTADGAHAVILAEFKEIRQDVVDLVSLAQQTTSALAQPSPDSASSKEVAAQYTSTLEALKGKLMDQLSKLEEGAALRRHVPVNDLDAAALDVLQQLQ